MKKIKNAFPLSAAALILLALAFTIICPRILGGYAFNVLNVALIYALAVYGASILTGMCGQMSFAYVTFIGLGAYYAANLSAARLGAQLSPLSILLTVPVVTGIIGLLLGLVLFRLKGSFFVFGTLGLVNIASIFFGNYIPLFNGPNGIAAIPRLTVGSLEFKTNEQWFYLLMALCVVGYIVVERIRNTKFGRSMASVKDNEVAALSMGVNVYATKVFAFGLSAAFCGLAGALYALQSGFVGATLFNYASSTKIIIMLTMGGMNHTIGAVIGSIVVSALPELFRGLQAFLQLAFGLVVILLMVFKPSGISGMAHGIAESCKLSLTKSRKGAD